MAKLVTSRSVNHNPNKSVEVTQPPSDSVSSLCFSPKANFLVATSWDNQVRCWEVVKNGTNVSTVPKASISHDQPVLCSDWNADGTAVFSGGCDKQAKLWLLASNQPVTVAMHEAPIKQLTWLSEMNLLVTGSWDKTLKYWDLRQQTPVHTQQLPERCYTMTVRHPLMIVGTADRNLIVFNLQSPQYSANKQQYLVTMDLIDAYTLYYSLEAMLYIYPHLNWWPGLNKNVHCFIGLQPAGRVLPSTEFKRITSSLKEQTRCMAAFPDQKGFLVGSIEGRVGVHHLDDAQQNKNFTFKCHRDGNSIYGINSLNFHPVHHTFATAGSDGVVTFWDKDSKQRLKALERCQAPIPCSAFNNDGSIFAYSVCYDWSRGAEKHNPATAKTHIFLHMPQEHEVKARPKAGTSGTKK